MGFWAGMHWSVSMEQGQKYHCLHFYLSTKFQVADPEVINYWHFDIWTLLKDIYLVPKLPTISDDEDKAEESSSDGMVWKVVDEYNDDEEEEIPAKKGRGKKAAPKKTRGKKAAPKKAKGKK
jgi:hypothetical protein